MKESICLYDRYIKNFRCKYYITKSTNDYITGEELDSCFGVKIDKLDEFGKLLDSEEVDAIGISESEVRNFVRVLTEGRVTPITLNDIAADMKV